MTTIVFLSFNTILKIYINSINGLYPGSLGGIQYSNSMLFLPSIIEKKTLQPKHLGVYRGCQVPVYLN